jgi:hypothetical protein
MKQEEIKQAEGTLPVPELEPTQEDLRGADGEENQDEQI